MEEDKNPRLLSPAKLQGGPCGGLEKFKRVVVPVSLTKSNKDYTSLPAALAFSMTMLTLLLVVPAEYSTEILLNLHYWLAMMTEITVIRETFTTVGVTETVATDNRSQLRTHTAYTEFIEGVITVH